MEVFLSRAESRQVDEIAINEFGMTGLVLMENAGRGCADLLETLGIEGPVVICCGKGNNAGDGFVIARHLERRGHLVQVLLWSEPKELRGDAAHNCRILQLAGTPLLVCPAHGGASWLERQLAGAEWIVDALLGTGSQGAPRPPLDSVIETLNRSGARKFAVDLPSGLDCDTGEPSAATFRADHTATFVAPKIGFKSPRATALLGVIHVVDIGVPQGLFQKILTCRQDGTPSRDSVS